MDRLYATRLAAPLVKFFEQQAAATTADVSCVGLIHDKVVFTPLTDAVSSLDPKVRRNEERTKQDR